MPPTARRKGTARGVTARERERGDKDRRTAQDGYERLMVNIGKADGFFPGNLMELVNRSVTGSKPEIGRIDLLPEYTLFDVRKKDARRVVDALRNADFFGRKVRAEFATDRDYAREAKDRRKKSDLRKERGEKKEKTKKSSKASARTDYDMSLGIEKAPGKKSKKSKDTEKPKYNGNFDIFKKK